MFPAWRRILEDRQTWPLIGLLPLVVFAIAMLVVFARQQGRETRSEMHRHLDALVRRVEHRIDDHLALLKALSVLPWMRERDFERLKAYLDDLRAGYPAWRNVIVTDRERQLFNLRTYPAVMPVREPATIAAALRIGAPVIGAVEDGIVALCIPVPVADGPAMTVVVALHVSAVAQVFADAALPAGWRAVVVDRGGAVIAATSRAEAAAGPPLPLPDLASLAGDGLDEVRRLRVSDADSLVLAKSIATAGWTAALVAPGAALYAGALRLDHALYAAAALATLASVLLYLAATRGAARRAEEARSALARLEAGERRFRDGIESMSEGFLLFDRDDRLVIWNRRYLEFEPDLADRIAVGMSGRDLITAVLDLALSHLSPAERRQAVEQRLQARAALQGYAYTTRDGRRIEISDRRASGGGTVSTFHDATARHLWTRRVAESEARFRDFAESASDWFWETGPDHRYTFLLANARQGPVPSVALGKSRIELVQHLGCPVPEALIELERRMDRREVIHDFEYARPRVETGVPVVFEVSGRPIFAPEGRFLGYRGTGRDVTERKRQETELARALALEQELNAEQRRFVAIVSHEFRTPLTIIDGATQRILARLATDDPEIRKRLDRIRASVARMTEIIDRTLSSARLDAGRIEFQPCPFDLAAMLADACERQRQASPAFDIVLACPERALTIEADPRLIDLVLSNLLSNAVKYSGSARRIDVEATDDEAAIEIAVRDRGVGIPEDEMPKLFTRFFRARTATGISGTGLGLHLCREFVALHGGTMTAASIVGSGSTISIRLPRRPPMRAIAAA